MKLTKLLSLLLALCLILSFTACQGQPDSQPDEADFGAMTEAVDYASQVKLNMGSETAKQEVTVKTFIDGDTTHFNVPTDVSDNGVLKARYLAINTPESTGKIEEYGKKASAFTKEKLSNAVSIIVESDTAGWDIDSTGERYLVWVWYKTAEDAEYRNLNIEILQEGLAIANSTSQNRYGSMAMAALNQAKEHGLNLYSGEKDPDFYYGEAVEMTRKELRCNIADYNGVKVAFSGVITVNDGSSVYIEEYDAETGIYYGISVYYGYGLTGEGLDILSVGNESRIVGTVQYYEAGGTYQVSGLTYRQMRPDDPGNIQKISEGNSAAFMPITADRLVNGKVSVDISEDEVKEFDYAQLAMSTSVSLTDLTVKEIYTTKNEDSSNFGAMTLTCEQDGVTITVRTAVLYDGNGKTVTEDAYAGKTIDIKGIIDYYDGAYQVKVLTAKNITVK